MAEITLKEESALEIGKQLAFFFSRTTKHCWRYSNGGLELEEEKQQTSYLEKIVVVLKKWWCFLVV